MSYIYTFTRKGQEIEAKGYNLWNGAKNAGLTIFRVDKLSTQYLQNTPFEKRERNVWVIGEQGETSLYLVKQRYE